MTHLGTLRIVKVAALVTAQDNGRRGGQHLGLCQSGAADAYSYYWSNTLLGNLKSAPVLEICLGAFEVEFSHATEIALCGADMSAQLNGQNIKNWCTYSIQAGDYLRLNYSRKGLWCYLAIKGGFLFKQTLFSSVAFVAREGQGCNQANAIAAGVYLHYAPQANKTKAISQKALKPGFIPSYAGDLDLHVYPAYQYAGFNELQRQQFTTGAYTVSSHSDRMGYRLQGQPILYGGKKVVSEGIAYGAVQIPADGQPIVLLNDRQTIGGYPKIGCVAKQDCSKLAQRRPGDKVFFKWRNFSE